MEFQKIASLFDEPIQLPKYKYKRWTKVQDSAQGNYNGSIKINCNTLRDKLVDYSSGYILLTGYIASTDNNNPLAATSIIGLQNGSNAVIDKTTVRLNNVDIETSQHVYFITG